MKLYYKEIKNNGIIKYAISYEEDCADVIEFVSLSILENYNNDIKEYIKDNYSKDCEIEETF